MNEVMNLEVMDGEDDSVEFDRTLRDTETRAMAAKAASMQGKDKQFQIEQIKEIEIQMALRNEGISKKEQRKDAIVFTSEILAIDERQEDAESDSYMKELKAVDATKPEPEYKVIKRLEYAVEDDTDSIIAKSRKEYVMWFRAHQRKSARATLEMCRTVYEAYKSLKEVDFNTFCTDIGYDDESSTIRKFIAIGKVYPRLIEHAEKMPIAWTSIYLLTQIPADDFDLMIQRNYCFGKLSGGELKELVDKTKDSNNIISPFRKAKKDLGHQVGSIYFTKLPDDTDFRLLQKAFAEVMARLPVKLSLRKEVIDVFANRSKQRYEKLKKEAPEAAIKPQDWDYGEAANSVHVKESKAA